jgi:ParB/RepB/Spo0J family partition protein
MSDPVKGSIASVLAERLAQASAVDGDPGEIDLGDLTAAQEAGSAAAPPPELVSIPLDLISPAPDGQVRKDFDEERLKALAESLKRSGVREPIIVTPHGAEPGKFQIVAGERRWRAAQLAGLAEVPCIVDGSLVDRKDKLLAQAEENLHRENLNPVEEAAVLVQLMEIRGIDVREAGELMGKSYRQAKRLQQIHAAAPPIKKALASGKIDGRAANELVRIFAVFAREDETPGSAVALRRIEALVEKVAAGGWSLRKLEQYGARGGKEPPANQEYGPAAVDVSGRAAEKCPPKPLVIRDGARVVIDATRLESGEVTPDERAELIATLEDLLGKARRARVCA